MASNTYGGRPRARRTGGPTVFACPSCGGRLHRAHGTIECGGCGHVPRHGAD